LNLTENRRFEFAVAAAAGAVATVKKRGGSFGHQDRTGLCVGG
jgi:hypothetical protein